MKHNTVLYNVTEIFSMSMEFDVAAEAMAPICDMGSAVARFTRNRHHTVTNQHASSIHRRILYISFTKIPLNLRSSLSVTDGGFHISKIAKYIRKIRIKFLPADGLVPNQLAKVILKSWEHFKDIKPPP